MSELHGTVTEAQILSAVIAPETGDLPAEHARLLLDLKFRQAAIDRMNELAEKNRQGVLTETERTEMEKYMRVGNFLSLIKSKARRSLQDHTAE